MAEILLGSSSERRKELLKSLDIGFISYSPKIEEVFSNDPYESTLRIAKDKFEHCKNIFPNKFIITADTLVHCKDKILGKPSNKEDAIEYLNLLSSNEHEVITTVCMGYEVQSFTVATKVKFFSLTNDVIEWYINTGEWKGKAGGYAIQGFGKVLISSINGDYFNVVGFPISTVWHKLKKLNII